MVTDCFQHTTINSDPAACLTENQFSDLELRLMLFWAKHPHAKLSLYSFSTAMDNARNDLRNAIASLVGKGILKDQYNSDLTTYSLTDDQTTQDFMGKPVRDLDIRKIHFHERDLALAPRFVVHFLLQLS